METLLVIIGLMLIASLTLALLSSILHVAAQGFLDLCDALSGIVRLIRRG